MKAPFQEHYPLTGFELLRLRAEDAPLIASAMVAMEPWRTLKYGAAPLERYLLAQDPALQRYTVWVGSAVSGIVAVRYPWLKGAYLELIALFPNQQGQGLGTAILQWLEQETQAHANNLWVLVSAFNKSARRFYFQYGFREIGPIEALVSTHSTELLLRKVLRSPP